MQNNSAIGTYLHTKNLAYNVRFKVYNEIALGNCENFYYAIGTAG